jgi:HAE1 family hydrophobic/amphiphilic exporter-1
MKLVELSIKRPVSTTVAVLFLALFGFIAMWNIPIQLVPTVEQPVINISTFWPGASPQEVEREITIKQEEMLKGVEGITKITSSSSSDRSNISLTFRTSEDINTAMIRVSNRLDQVLKYPENALKPVITNVDANTSALAWFILLPTEQNGFQGDLSTLHQFVEDQIKPAFERVQGVAQSNFFGGRQQEMHVIFEPSKLASRGITLANLASALERGNADVSAGDFNEGKRRYVVRTMGKFNTPSDIENLVISSVNQTPVYVRDVAEVKLGYGKEEARTYYFDQRMIAINAIKAPNSNVLHVMEDLKAVQKELNSELLNPKGLQIILASDQTEYIYSAMSLVKQSLLIGAFLAIFVLLIFLRSPSSTLVIAVSIPISVIGTFAMMAAFGRTLNVISLAGMAFAIGMVVDNSIVVLENIYRHKQMGKDSFTASFEGAREVWGAVLASTLTTIAVFIPVIFIKEEGGQLFQDIAIAISCGVGLSLIVAITVIPSLSARLIKRTHQHEGKLAQWSQSAVTFLISLLGLVNKTLFRQILTVFGVTILALWFSWQLLPKAEYLPTGNQNFLFGMLFPPPGYSVDEVAKYHDRYTKALNPLWEKGSEDSKSMHGGGIRGFFYVALASQAFMGVQANEPLRIRELYPDFQAVNSSLPGAFAFITQASIFQNASGADRTINIQLVGPELEHLIQLGGQVLGTVQQILPGSQVRPVPSLDLGNPEVQFTPDREKMAKVGLATNEVGFAVNALVDGVKVDDYFYEGNEIDLKILGQSENRRLELRGHLENTRNHTQSIGQFPMATPSGDLIPLSALGELKISNGPVQINHYERERTIAIAVTPPAETALEEAMDLINAKVIGPMREHHQLGGMYRSVLSGSADKLTLMQQELKWNFILALIITYLLLSSLFESFFYPFVILFSVPLASVGGVLGLRMLNLFSSEVQPMDILTMLGFVILVGTVVNNAILIVHQALNHLRRDKMELIDAILTSTRTRVRPIFMSISTSVFGMLPLVLFPGAGSELYRGLGSVIVGGLVCSTFFTLILVPTMFSLGWQIKTRVFQ